MNNVLAQLASTVSANQDSFVVHLAVYVRTLTSVVPICTIVQNILFAETSQAVTNASVRMGTKVKTAVILMNAQLEHINVLSTNSAKTRSEVIIASATRVFIKTKEMYVPISMNAPSTLLIAQ